MERGRKLGLMVHLLRETTLKIRNLGKGSFSGLTATVMLENSGIIEKVVKE